jgi:hypothetical protein
MKKPGFILLSLFAFCFLILSCSPITWNINIPEGEHYPKPLVKPLPLKIGVYYNDDFRKYESIQSFSNSINVQELERFNIRLGKANIALFDYIFPHVFEEVTPIQDLSEANDDMGNFDIILEPSITHYSCYITAGLLKKTKCHVYITYAITFYSLNSARLGTWSISAEGFESIIIGNFPWGLVKDATQSAMRDIAAQFMTGICKDMATKKLFDKHCNK